MTSEPALYADPAHQPFDLEPSPTTALSAPMSALLLHGFMGTPAEMRPLASALSSAGLRVHVPLLRGMGSDIANLRSVNADQWIDDTVRAWERARTGAAASFLVGFSFGGALALNAAAAAAPTGLVLLAPYVRLIDLPSWTIRLGMPVLKRTVKSYSPFARASFDDPNVRATFEAMDPSLDLDDPAVRERLRHESAIPMQTLDQLRKVTDLARKRARDVRAPTLVIQGTNDETSTVERTRKLVAALRGEVSLKEVAADHLLVRDDRPAWSQIESDVLAFIAEHASRAAGTRA